MPWPLHLPPSTKHCNKFFSTNKISKQTSTTSLPKSLTSKLAYFLLDFNLMTQDLHPSIPPPPSNSIYPNSMVLTPWVGSSKLINFLSFTILLMTNVSKWHLSTWKVKPSPGTNGCIRTVNSSPGPYSFNLWNSASRRKSDRGSTGAVLLELFCVGSQTTHPSRGTGFSTHVSHTSY